MRLLYQINSIKNASIVRYTEPEWLISDVVLHEDAFDILIISRALGKHQGHTIAKEMVRLNPFCQVVLLCDNNVIQSYDYEIGHAFFLPKEMVPLRLATVIDCAAHILEKNGEKYLLVISNRDKLLLPVSETFYLERIQRKTAIVMEAETIETYQTPQEILINECDSAFARCHRSIYVNIGKIRRFGRREIELKNKTTLPVGGSFADELEKAYDTYCSRLISPGNRYTIF